MSAVIPGPAESRNPESRPPAPSWIPGSVLAHRPGMTTRAIRLAAMLTVKASSVALNTNDTTPWPATMRRILLEVTATSDTCEVMPMTREK